MRKASRLVCGTACVVAAAGAARGQCIWSHHDSIPGAGDIAVYDSLRQRVLFICVDPACASTIISAWDGSHWTQTSSNGPPLRRDTAAAYDAARDRVVLFGGENDSVYPPSCFGDTWEWDGSAWTQATTPTSPQARSGHSMAYDAARQRTVLFGGSGPGSGTNWIVYGETWEWDGHSWVQAANAGPPRRWFGFMSYDPARQLCLLYGGHGYQLGPISDLWEWNGATWNQRASAGPFNEATFAVFDSTRERLIVGRGLSSASLAQTWELDPVGVQWTLRDPGNSPSAPAAFDQARSRTVFWAAEYNGAGSVTDPFVGYVQPSTYYFYLNAGLSLQANAVGTALSFRWLFEGQPLTNGGQYSGVDTDKLSIHSLTYANSGSYTVEASNSCWQSSNGITFYVTPCYANCDHSTAPPVLNANDFQCFLNKFAALDPYANCDDSTGPPIFNANDFQCFLNAYMAGCP